MSNLSGKFNDKPKQLNLLSLNTQSVIAKKAPFGNLISERNPDIIALSETWLKPEILSSEFFPAGYKIFRKDRHDGYGGVLLACRDSLNCHQLFIDSEAEIVACQIAFDNQESLIICAFYRPPSKELESVLKLCDTFEYILSLHPHLPMWLVGDLNLPNIDWNHYCIRNSVYPSSLCDTIIDFIHEYGFIQTVDFATRDNNILDVFFTNRPCLIRRCYPIAGISDHEAVFIESFITAAFKAKKNSYLAQGKHVIYQEPINTVQSAFFQ